MNFQKKSSKTVTRQFYFLDREEKIRALKSIRKILKEGRKVTSDETSLYYSEEDLDYLRLPVRIVKKLEKKQMLEKLFSNIFCYCKTNVFFMFFVD